MALRTALRLKQALWSDGHNQPTTGAKKGAAMRVVERRAKPPAAIAGVAPASRLMRPVGYSDPFGRATDTPRILRARNPPVNVNPSQSPVRAALTTDPVRAA